jgi:hypothetical protein
VPESGDIGLVASKLTLTDPPWERYSLQPTTYCGLSVVAAGVAFPVVGGYLEAAEVCNGCVGVGVGGV